MTDVPVYRSAAANRSAPKRMLDLGGAAIGLTIGLPILAAIALGVRWTGGAPALHAQQRIGRGGRLFWLYKFRTLPLEASSRSATQWTARAEHPLLRWLRRTGLDELPQLWNVLKGEMSLVGPRPERPFFVDKFVRRMPHYRLRLEGAPGLTGWAQIHGLRGDTSIAERLEYDLEYLSKRTLALDLHILARTAAGFFRAALKGASDAEPTEPWPKRSTSSNS